MNVGPVGMHMCAVFVSMPVFVVRRRFAMNVIVMHIVVPVKMCVLKLAVFMIVLVFLQRHKRNRGDQQRKGNHL